MIRFPFPQIGRGALLAMGAVGLLAGCPASGTHGDSGTTGAIGPESNTVSNECATGGDACCPGASWCGNGSSSTTWVGPDGPNTATYDPECETSDGDCCDPFLCDSGSGPWTGGCLCFETTEVALVDMCERPPSCGIVKLPSTDKDDRVQPLTPEEEMANLAAIACFFDAIADGQESVIHSDQSLVNGFDNYARTIIAEESGDGVTWVHRVEDLVETITPVVYTYGIATLTSCSDASDSVGQWDCITAALAERGTTGPHCTGQIEFKSPG